MGSYLSFSEEEYPGVILGHEISGTVEALADDVDPTTCNVKVGDKVMVYPWVKGCFECGVCKAGNNLFCQTPIQSDIGLGHYVAEDVSSGGYSSHIAIPEARLLLKVPANIPMDIASMLPCSGLTTFTALNKVKGSLELASRHVAKPTLLIIGTGGLGIWCTTLARHVLKPLDVKIVCADTLEAKRELALKAGADDFVVIDRDLDPEEMVGRIMEKGDDGIHAAIDFVGAPQTATLGLHSLQAGGKLLLVGLKGGSFSISIAASIFKGVSVEGSYVGPIESLEKLNAVVAAANDIHFPQVEKHKLDDINDILDRLRKGQVKGRAVLEFENNS